MSQPPFLVGVLTGRPTRPTWREGLVVGIVIGQVIVSLGLLIVSRMGV